MSHEKKNACPTVGAAGQAVENGRVCETIQPSIHDSIISAAGRQAFRVADLLHPGAENAIPLKHLKELAGLPGREVRRMIQTERLDGAPILSNCIGGYYLPADDAERKRFVNSMLHRAMEIAAVAAAVEQAEV